MKSKYELENTTRLLCRAARECGKTEKHFPVAFFMTLGILTMFIHACLQLSGITTGAY